MGKKRNRKQKENARYAILVATLCICLGALIIALAIKNNSDKKDDTSTGTDSQTSTERQEVATTQTITQANEQVYNSVNDIVMNKDTGEASINIANDPENIYSLKVTVELDSGEVLYESELIAPGETLGTVTFDIELSEGEYSVIVSVDSYTTDGSELASGVIYTRTLTVE